MTDAIDGEARTRQIERDIEHTRDEMDHTLTALEHRLSPDELLQSGARSLRDRAREITDDTMAAVKRRPALLVMAGLLLGARYMLRPSRQQRRQQQATEDFERAWGALSAGLDRAKAQSRLGGRKLARVARDVLDDPTNYAGPAWHAAEELGIWGGQQARRVLQQARRESWGMARALGGEADAYPLTALVILGLAGGLAMFGARRLRR